MSNSRNDILIVYEGFRFNREVIHLKQFSQIEPKHILF